MLPANMFLIPHYVKAKTPELLQRAMLELNLSQSKEYRYFDISFVSGNWYAWYFESVEAGLIAIPSVVANKKVEVV